MCVKSDHKLIFRKRLSPNSYFDDDIVITSGLIAEGSNEQLKKNDKNFLLKSVNHKKEASQRGASFNCNASIITYQ